MQAVQSEISFSNLRKFVTAEIIFGAGARKLAGRMATRFGANRVLVVTDPGVIAAGWTEEVVESLNHAGIETVIFSEVTPNPRTTEAAAGAEMYLGESCDMIVAVGGGSPMDCAKGIGIVSSNGGSVTDYEGADLLMAPTPPLICVPTTGGTSADVSQFAIFSDPSSRRKLAVISKSVVPDVALIDPETLTTMSPYLTACTGMDALTHAIEAFVSLSNSPLTDLNSLNAIRLVTANLQRTIDSPNDIAARTQVMLGSLEAGLAFSNASLGVNHALAHSLGGYFDLAHGECNALLLDHVIAFNFPEAPERFRAIADAMGVDARGLTDNEIKRALMSRVSELRKDLGITKTLGQDGVRSSDIPTLADRALSDICLITNPRRCRQRDIEVIYEESI